MCLCARTTEHKWGFSFYHGCSGVWLSGLVASTFTQWATSPDLLKMGICGVLWTHCYWLRFAIARLRDCTTQAALVPTTLETSQKIPGFSWIEEIVQGSDYWWFHWEFPWPTCLPTCPILSSFWGALSWSFSFDPGDTPWHLQKLEISLWFTTSQVLWTGRVC